VAATAATVFLSLPDGHASLAVARDITASAERVTTVVVDLSTIAIEASQTVHTHLARAGIAYIEAPVSGGQAGARAGTVTVMWSGPAALLESHRVILASISKNVFHVGDRPGQGQAMKLLNNFLSATALVATSEAILFGLAQGLNLKTMIDVLNVSTGRNTATSDKFPSRIITGTYDAGFRTALMAKDMELYMEGVTKARTPGHLGEVVHRIWHQAHKDMPSSDFTEIYRFLQQMSRPPRERKP
jgi:3-hydroxyisobutyrate dehydrogenase